jgi:benzoyl-CoA reductase subunit C
MGALEKMTRVIDDRHGYAKGWRERTGGRIAGYLCTYVPEEILFAAGVLPVRILGSHEPEDVTAPYVYGMFCTYCRDTLAQGLLGRYDYLDGLIHGYCCIHIRQTYDSWLRHAPVPFSYLLYVPDHIESDRAIPHLVSHMGQMKVAVEEWTGKPITNEALSAAIEVFDTNRRLTQKLYDLQKGNPPRFAGVDILKVVLASQLMDKVEHNKLLEELLAEASQLPPQEESDVRLMLIASEVDDVEFVELIESLGATIVVDDNCVGTRYFLGEVGNSTEPIAALAERYARGKPLCPIKDISTRERSRPPHIVGLAAEYGVQGVIFARNKFCDPHEYDTPSIAKALGEKDIPSIVLECDIVNPLGQFRTRVEAFLEMMRVEAL